MEYNFFADLLNKFSQLTPWVQAIVSAGTVVIMVAPFYFLKETMRVIVNRNKEPEKEWRDKLYRGGHDKA